MDESLRQAVWQRAEERCEYCKLPQSAAPVTTFHIDHIVARQHIDEDVADLGRLALACPRCNLHKGTNLASVDPKTGDMVRLFHPRKDRWPEHFEFNGPWVVGKTAIGRATIRLLMMNSADRAQLRRLLIRRGEL